MADIFISYARKDRSRVRLLADALAAHGWSVWWDREIPAGRTFDEVIAEALAGARCVVVVWSPESVGSSWVREEAEEGRRRKILIPILIGDARPPLGFGRIQAAELGDWNGDDTADAFRKLITDITSILDPAQARETLTPAAHVIERQTAAPVATQRDAVSTARAAPSPGSHERDGDLIAPVAVTPPRVLIGPGGRALRKWSPPALILMVLLGLGVYRLGTGGNDSAQPRPTTAPSAAPTLRLSAVLTEGGEPLPSGVSYEVYEADRDPEGNRKAVVTSPSYADAPRFPLPAGRYHVAAEYGSASAGTEVEIAPGTLVLQTLNLRAGVLSLSSLLSAGGQPLATGVGYEVYEAAKDIEGNRKRVVTSPTYAGPPRFPLAAGRYYVTAAYESASASTEVDVASGEIKPLSMDLHAGILTLSSLLGAGSQLLASGVAYEVFELAKDIEGNRKRIVSSPTYAGPPRFPLPAGRYYVTAAYGSASSGLETEVKPGEVKPLAMNLHAGILALSSVGPTGRALAGGVTYDVFEAAKDVEGNRKRIVSSPSYEGPPRFPVPVGGYFVTASSDAGRGEAEATVSEGESQQVQIRLSRAAP